MDPYSHQYSHGRGLDGFSYNQNGTSARYNPPFPRSNPVGTIPFPNIYSPNSMTDHYSQQQVPQRPEGPPFEDTKVVHHVVTGRNQQLVPDISASIQKGFFQVDNKWTCYRRNYFTVACSFTFKNQLPDGPIYLQRHSQLEPIQQFAISISARTAVMNNQESEARALVQHTPKRDKATESVPGRHVVQPASNQTMIAGDTMTAPSQLYRGSQHLPPTMISGYDAFGSHSHQAVPTSHTFERIQFQKATANNGKRRAQQQYFHVVVELSANLGRHGSEDNWVVVATKQSHPMVVRGRSPGHYKDNIRRDSQSSMDPDRGTGAGAEGHSHSMPMTSMMGGHTSSMDWTPSHRGQPYPGSSYRHAGRSDYSPDSVASSTTLTGTPTDAGFELPDAQSGKLVASYIPHRQLLTPLSATADDGMFNNNRSLLGRKRRYEDDVTESERSFHTSAGFLDNLSSTTFDFTSLPCPKTLCA